MATDIIVPLRYASRSHPPGLFYALAHERSTCRFEEHATRIVNARTRAEPPALAVEGMQLVRHATRVDDFEDADQVESVYVPEVRALVRDLTGASEVIVFHKLARREGGQQAGRRQPAGNAHIDYTAESFRLWARRELGDERAERLLAKRWSAVNVWRGTHPVERRPLAIADGRTITEDAMLEVPIHEAPGAPTPFVGVNISYDPDQRWYYYPDMRPDEALLFTLVDSDAARPQRAAHSAIDDPGSRPDAAPRASFEVRTMAFFD
ncbi:CmcJ/NvfI family oxidoreductase [Sphingomonas profundi]|uniref:CmcJ/NvfI family oxidoreductase n=1 Tax=Alterirhizorhabdus profundi TaxID=2681549 RepID=UPI0012E7E0FE|nr:CmcJ/NvfI family oxidoreductase [Sphingomonas profundi]